MVQDRRLLEGERTEAPCRFPLYIEYITQSTRNIQYYVYED
jgi:hypothetical protein